MRNFLFVTSLLVVAVACKRSEREHDRTRTAPAAPGRTGAAPKPTEPTGGATAPSETTKPVEGTSAEGESAGGTAQGQEGTTPASGTGGTGGTMGQLDCNRILPSSVRDRFLMNMTMTAQSPQQAMTAMCRFEGKTPDESGTVQAMCNAKTDTSAKEEADIKSKNPNAKDVEQVGRAAVMIETDRRKELTAWDNDSNCEIRIMVPKNIDAVAIARAVLDQLPLRG